ncbi:MAG: single-stranded-DNA-specific exonuclease RecJ [Candidatus Blackburnbacteria bacterium RIFCSPHIGHO2_01_FULL_43_15b]|uniref:Single-stranded-DNA-specific exonuclease RecJ n=1 Tax=Candidatus Blackburnbacteria bacterium RIFCSPHIGHO2_01_FULL_43_15b TaxID=1797513 RepID=A0A1G1V111_9BACT|nr:MAG: single-stranded-DNA-specific exonuclease RecJ [Candidatus Blackburnbacteria bacterium RIFCSPHIGHO2_01_FULL_43_15b]
MTQNRKHKAQSIDEIIKILLENRGIKTKEQKKEFFSPPDPNRLIPKEVGIDFLQLEKAVERIEKAIKKKEKIIVYGDYDVDGVCASAILWETLRSLGANTIPYIPSRFTEGYGLNIESIKKLKEGDSNISLIVTVDNGIVAHEKVDFAKSLGVDVIITDHHIPGATLPNAYAIVHTTQMSGAAVAWFLAKSLVEEVTGHVLGSSHPSQSLNDHLGLAALGTVADVLPLVGHNRSIVVYGLRALRKTSRIGIRALCKEAGIEQNDIDTFHIGFVIAPRMNAMGRLEHAMDSLRLLCTNDKEKATTLAYNLGKTNKTRQEKTESIFEHIQENFESIWNQKLPGILLAAHETYEEGVVGIVAGRLVEKYYRPSIVVCKGEEISKASARSINGIDIIQVIREVGDGILLNVGGHPMAAGFSLLTAKLGDFGKKLSLYSSKFTDHDFVKETRVDCEIDFSLLTNTLCKKLLEFAPFGFGNPTPIFITRNVQIDDVRLMGKDKNHLKLLLTQEGFGTMNAVGFRMGELYSSLSPDLSVDVVYSLEENIWNNHKSLQLKLKNICI